MKAKVFSLPWNELLAEYSALAALRESALEVTGLMTLDLRLWTTANFGDRQQLWGALSWAAVAARLRDAARGHGFEHELIRREAGLLELLGELRDLALLGLGSHLFAPRRKPATPAALRSAERVVAVGAAGSIGLARCVRGWADVIHLVEPHRLTVAVTRVRSSAVGLIPGGRLRASLGRLGGIEEVTLVAHHRVACDTAPLRAQPLPNAAPRPAATAALRGLAIRVLLPVLWPIAVTPRRTRRSWRTSRRAHRHAVTRSRRHSCPAVAEARFRERRPR